MNTDNNHNKGLAIFAKNPDFLISVSWFIQLFLLCSPQPPTPQPPSPLIIHVRSDFCFEHLMSTIVFRLRVTFVVYWALHVKCGCVEFNSLY